MNSVIFGLVDAVLFRPLCDARAAVAGAARDGFDQGMSGNLSGVRSCAISAKQVGAFFEVAGFTSGNGIYLGVGEEPPEPPRRRWRASYFALLGVHPARGRLLDESDDARPAGAGPGAQLRHLAEALRRGSGIIGTAVRVNAAVPVVGVAPRGLGVDLEQVPDVFIR